MKITTRHSPIQDYTQTIMLHLGFIITVLLLFCCFVVCPVPMNKEEEEIIKEQERNREEMEEIMREIEISCLGE